MTRLSLSAVTDRVKDDPTTDVGDVPVEVGQPHDGAVDSLLEAGHKFDALPRWLVTGNDPGPACRTMKLCDEWVHCVDLLNALRRCHVVLGEGRVVVGSGVGRDRGEGEE